MQIKQALVADDLGVSQSMVREALGRLAEEGLLESIPYRGYFVRRLSIRDVREIYQLRTALECLAAQICLPNLEESNFDELETLYEQIMASAKSGDSSDAISADLAFHRYLVNLSGNSRLLKSWDSLLGQCYYALHDLYQLQAEPSMESLAENHILIIEALASKDMRRITTAIEEHMNFASDMLLQRINDLSEAAS